MSARNRELAGLLLAGVLGSAAFAAAWIATTGAVTADWVVWSGVLGGLYLIAHVVTRMTVPFADPTLLPLVGLLTAIGLTVIYGLDPVEARKQVVWVAIGIGVFAITLVWLRHDYRVLERTKYLFGVSAIALLLLPSLPGVNVAPGAIALIVIM
jgi:hypothetical protein